MADKKAISKLNKEEALVELEELSKEVEFETEYTDKTPVAELRKLVKEGREALDGGDDEEEETPVDNEAEDGEDEERLAPPVEDEVVDDSPKSEKGDYLRQYQYKKDMPLGHLNTDPDPGSRAATMKKFLLSQKRISIMVPRDDGADPSIPKSVTLNGYRLDLPKQTYLEVPQSIAEVIMDSERQSVAALQPKRVDRKETKDGLNVGSVLG